MKENVRIGVVGLGMGGQHARQLAEGRIPHGELAAVCDLSPAALAAFPAVRHFSEVGEMIASGAIDALVIATPHYAHTPIGIAALARGLHVLVEKPISVHKADAEKLVAAHQAQTRAGRPLVFAAMFDTRTVPVYRKLHQLIHGPERTLGQIRRVTWTVTDWYRTQHYYDSGTWRATWRGEGGGVLVNQCPHNLDLFQWLFGMPRSIQALCRIGKYHDIEVEDEFHALLDFADGAVATLIGSTGEAPGVNRLEIAAENGLVVVEPERLRFTRNELPMTEFTRTSSEKWAKPATWDVAIPAPGAGGRHGEILANFVAAIREGAPLIAPAAEGLRSVELANAILYASFQRRAIDLPLDSATYAAFLQERIDQSPRQAD